MSSLKVGIAGTEPIILRFLTRKKLFYRGGILQDVFGIKITDKMILNEVYKKPAEKGLKNEG